MQRPSPSACVRSAGSFLRVSAERVLPIALHRWEGSSALPLPPSNWNPCFLEGAPPLAKMQSLSPALSRTALGVSATSLLPAECPLLASRWFALLWKHLPGPQRDWLLQERPRSTSSASSAPSWFSPFFQQALRGGERSSTWLLGTLFLAAATSLLDSARSQAMPQTPLSSGTDSWQSR